MPKRKTESPLVRFAMMFELIRAPDGKSPFKSGKMATLIYSSFSTFRRVGNDNGWSRCFRPRSMDQTNCQ